MPTLKVQATVVAMAADGSMSVVCDDGRTLCADAAAVRVGGWRAARPGQRVLLELDDRDGRVTAVLIPTGRGA